LVPEATNVDEATLKKLCAAKEKDFYTSDVSPLGVPFNNLRNSESDIERDNRIEKGRPGSSCPKGFLVSNTEFTKEPICTASRLYQKLKIDELNKLSLTLPAYQKRFREIVVKSCICNDLGEPAMKKVIPGDPNKRFTAICPGPNLAYFSKISTLEEMIGHIYGRKNLLDAGYRPHMFIKELQMYIEFFMKDFKKFLAEPDDMHWKYLMEFKKNLFEGINYYRGLFPKMVHETMEFRLKCLDELEKYQVNLQSFIEQHTPSFSSAPQPQPVASA
jgi:hypothetical protein